MLFKRLKQQKNTQIQDKSNTENLTKQVKPILSKNNRSNHKLIGDLKGANIYHSRLFKTRCYQRDYFKGNELTIISKPITMLINTSLIKFNKLNTILHEIRYIGDKDKKLTIRVNISYDRYIDLSLGSNGFKSLYICRNIYGNLVTYREKYEQVKKPSSRYTKIPKHYYCRETFKYLGEML
jgi:hypothetical protein